MADSNFQTLCEVQWSIQYSWDFSHYVNTKTNPKPLLLASTSKQGHQPQYIISHNSAQDYILNRVSLNCTLPSVWLPGNRQKRNKNESLNFMHGSILLSYTKWGTLMERLSRVWLPDQNFKTWNLILISFQTIPATIPSNILLQLNNWNSKSVTELGNKIKQKRDKIRSSCFGSDHPWKLRKVDFVMI